MAIKNLYGVYYPTKGKKQTQNPIRQQAAIAAMQGILSNPDGFEFLYKENEYHTIPIGVARLAIACADELIKQLNE